MSKEVEHIKKELKEQNHFLKSMLKSIDDIKKGRVKKFKFSKKNLAWITLTNLEPIESYLYIVVFN